MQISIANARTYIKDGKLTLPENAVYVGRAVKRYGLRASVLANPRRMGYTTGPRAAASRAKAIAVYRTWFGRRTQIFSTQIDELQRLYDQVKAGPLVLVCWCAPKPCHAEIIRDFLLEGAAS